VPSIRDYGQSKFYKTTRGRDDATERCYLPAVVFNFEPESGRRGASECANGRKCRVSYGAESTVKYSSGTERVFNVFFSRAGHAVAAHRVMLVYRGGGVVFVNRIPPRASESHG